MSLQRILTIFQKDLRDAIRDARVLVALLVPLGIGIFYNVTFQDTDTQVTGKIAFTAAGNTQLPARIAAVVGDTIDLRFAQVDSADDVRKEVANEDADLGLIIPAGFDAAVAAGQRPQIEVIRQSSPSFAGDYVLAELEPALRVMAGQQPPAQFRVSAADKPSESESALDKVGLRKWAIIASIVMMIAMIAMLAVPIILAEEGEKKTLDALVLVASDAEVVIAKASVGLFYVAVMVPLLLGLTQTGPTRIALFVATVALLAVALVGFGLLMAGLFKSANQLNTWSGIVLLPVIAPAFAIGLPAPRAVEIAAQVLPSGAAAKLLMNAMAAEQVFSNQLLALLTIVAWGALAYALLLWQLSRRQA